MNFWTSMLVSKTLVVHHTENTILRVKHGGCSIKLWGGFSVARIRKLIKLGVKMDGATYSRIPEDNVKQSAKVLKFGRRFIFQQGQWPKTYRNRAWAIFLRKNEQKFHYQDVQYRQTLRLRRLTTVILPEVIQPASVFEYLNTYTG